MNEALTIQGCDALLLPFLRANDPSVAEHLLAEIIQEHADPVIAKILKSKLRVSLNGSHGSKENQDALEIAAELRAALINDLRAVQQQRDQKTITSFQDYVAVKTYSACADYFREKNPRRWRLKNALRYQLKHDPRLALWKAEDNRWYAGLREWQNGVVAANPLPSAVRKSVADIPLSDLLMEIFGSTATPLEFERVVTLAAEALSITDARPESLESDDHETVFHELPSAPGVDLLLEQRIYLEQLWTEVCRLPALQRAALLLNLRDAQGGSAIFFIPLLEIASQQQIAECLALSAEDFAAVWHELPLDDARIANRLDITRQQVINLRKTARERLQRRM